MTQESPRTIRGSLLQALPETMGALERVAERNDLPLSGVTQSLSFTEALFADLTEYLSIDVLRTPELAGPVEAMEGALRAIRVAALAIQQRGPAAAEKALNQFGEAEAVLDGHLPCPRSLSASRDIPSGA